MGDVITCPACGTANPGSARFCMNCGKPLEQTCSNCSFVSPLSAHFCPNCGNDLSSRVVAGEPTHHTGPAGVVEGLRPGSEAGTVEGERRTITMLFCDVKGSTASAERLDPEAWTEIMNGAFERLIEPVYRYDGTVAQLMGDAILAFWGAPRAHEDDPQRAVLAALDILAAVDGYAEEVEAGYGIEFGVRIGMNTGLAVVGQVGSHEREEYTALGDEVNVAARMEQTAEPGTIQITDATARLIAGEFDLIPIGPIHAKGKTEPVMTHGGVGVGRGRGESRETGHLVGRDAELATVQAIIADLRRGIGQVATVLGETGLGKTRLMAEHGDVVG